MNPKEEANTDTEQSSKRHFTATAFLVCGDSILLHWHNKVLEWLPPGGHIEENEDPVEAVIREVKEETGLTVQVYGTPYLPQGDSFPKTILEPRHILIENIEDPIDGQHQHIDMIYYCKLIDCRYESSNWVWVSLNELISGKKLGDGSHHKSPPNDVQEIGIHAIKTLQ